MQLVIYSTNFVFRPTRLLLSHSRTLVNLYTGTHTLFLTETSLYLSLFFVGGVNFPDQVGETGRGKTAPMVLPCGPKNGAENVSYSSNDFRMTAQSSGRS